MLYLWFRIIPVPCVLCFQAFGLAGYDKSNENIFVIRILLLLGFINFIPAESEASRVHRRKPALGVAALQGVAQVSAVHENANIRHQADIPQVEGKRGTKVQGQFWHEITGARAAHFQCHQYRLRFDQISRNRMREKVTASIIFKDRKASYPRR